MVTSEFTAPGLIRVIVPVSWLRAEKRTPSQSVTTITEGALTMAITELPAFRPRLTALPCVMVATSSA